MFLFVDLLYLKLTSPSRKGFCLLLLKYSCFLFTFAQDDEEADTVGCCTLKVENVTAEGHNKLKVFELIYLSNFLSVF
jgi:hypothetical protein